MKKIIPVFISFILAVSLCACGKEKNVKFTPKLNEPFTVSAKIVYGDMESDAVFRKYGKANWDIEFSSPNTLAGVILSYRDDNVDASYKGLSFSVPKTALPIKSIISAFIEAVDSTAEMPEIEAVEKEGLMEIEGELSQGKYVLKLDKNGGIAVFVMANLELNITFTDFHLDSSAATDASEGTQEATMPTEQLTEPTEEASEAMTEAAAES
ncbi:MAG: hypothetical protein NC320_10340 [Clostridium sp.]|nr:hypothetical protein [Clostridium sp.]MCM1548089.1 hypothetical protein [Ruminococcus sp.]